MLPALKRDQLSHRNLSTRATVLVRDEALAQVFVQGLSIALKEFRGHDEPDQLSRVRVRIRDARLALPGSHEMRPRARSRASISSIPSASFLSFPSGSGSIGSQPSFRAFELSFHEATSVKI